MEPVSLEDIKHHLVLDPEDTSEDAYLSSLLVAARRSCELRIRRAIASEDDTPGLDEGEQDMVRHAIRLIVGHWYANREAVSPDGRGAASETPIAVSWLLDPLRSFSDC
ncbi:phage protein [Altererythrobacter sp. B11]|uniref:head-tail connector protein n=1 Tax=Altererythrobacter sp. B11 TaxID=2060312 RepID=UPI000DC70D00|nr:head-tail connector protein [Altererythrobacter sp. B11]BBC72917.1 phage protein [Altererythrobacter sp. B11]